MRAWESADCTHTLTAWVEGHRDCKWLTLPVCRQATLAMKVCECVYSAHADMHFCASVSQYVLTTLLDSVTVSTGTVCVQEFFTAGELHTTGWAVARWTDNRQAGMGMRHTQMWYDEQREVQCSCVYSRLTKKTKTRALWFSLNIRSDTCTHTHQSRKWPCCSSSLALTPDLSLQSVK